MREPSFLLIDAGNTRVKWATASVRGAIRPAGFIETKKAMEPWARALARRHSTGRVLVACVVPSLVPFLRSAFGSRLFLVRGTSPELGLRFDYPKPVELGADRLSACVAVHAANNLPAIIISSGTATAFSVLDCSGKFCGGVIAPGLETQLESLIARTGQLPSIVLREPRTALARSTADAIRAGVILNFRGGVNEIVRQLSTALGDPAPHLFLTGGTAHYLAGKLERAAELRPLLVFEGLRIMATRLP